MNSHIHEPPNAIEAGVVQLNGKLYMLNAEGGFTPHEAVKPVQLLEDQMVRKIIAYADELSRQIDRFKGHTADDLATFQALLAEKYEAKPRGGARGNVSFTSFDGLMRVQIRMADNLVFGPELQVAKTLIDECLREWSADAHSGIRAIVERAFAVDQEGKLNRNAILGLRSVEIDDGRWKRAMEAITDSIRVIGRKTYFRFYRRASVNEEFVPITVDLASAEAPAQPVPPPHRSLSTSRTAESEVM